MQTGLENVPQEKEFFPQGISSLLQMARLQGKSILQGERQGKDMFIPLGLCFQKVDPFLQGT